MLGRYSLFCLVGAFVLAFTLGCSSGNSNPTTPDVAQPKTVTNGSEYPTHLWGTWEITLDPATETAEIVPLRGIEFTCNVTQFMQPPIAPQHWMGIEIDPLTDFATGYVVVDVIFTHPFPGLDVYTGFDVRGVCIGNGSIAGIADTNILYAGEEDLRVLNADGLIRWYNPTEFTTYGTIFGFTLGKLGTPSTDFNATLNGYKYFCDGLEEEDNAAEFFADPSCSNPRGFFSAGNTLRRKYELQFPLDAGIPVYQFQYAVVASWKDPDPNPPINIPDDFNLSANCQEAYCFSAADQSDLYYYDPANNGGTLSLMVRVFDHQGAASSTGVKDEISAIHLETPNGLITTGGIATFEGATLTGALYAEDEISATWLLEVEEVEPTAPGEFPVLVVIESAVPNDYDPGYPGFDFPSGALAAYFMTSVSVTTTLPMQIGSIDPDNGELNEALIDVEVTGLGFLDGAEVTLIKNDDPGVVISAENEIISGGGTLITCDIDLDSLVAEIGTYHVRVTNPTSDFAQLDDGFEVTEPQWAYWWECIMYNPFHLGRNPTANTPDPEDLTQVYSVSAPNSYKYCTPVVAEDKIFFVGSTSFYSNSSTRVYCHDLQDGAPLWNAQINPSGYSQRCHPGYAFYDAGDGTERLIVGGDEIYCFNAVTGAELWTFDDTDPSDQNWLGTQLTVYDGKVISKGRREGCMYILDAQTGNLIHETPIMAVFEAGVAAKDGKAYALGYSFGTHENYLQCIDIDTGTVDWTWQSGYTTYTVDHYNNPLIDNGRAYFASYHGEVFCVAVEDQGSYSAGDLIWTYQASPANPMNGGVCKLGDDLFFASAFTSRVHCITDSGDSPTWKWSSPFTGYFDGMTTVTTTPSYPNGVVIAAELYGTLYFLDATDGSTITTISAGQYQRGGAALVDDYVIIAGSSSLRVYQ